MLLVLFLQNSDYRVFVLGVSLNAESAGVCWRLINYLL